MTPDKYTDARARRDKHLSAVVQSASRKKVVVAGPGTGKTYLFKKILEGKPSSLTLSFINALVDDLSIELYGMSEVRTLHSYARGLLKKLWRNREINIFPRLSDLVREDLEILAGEVVDFGEIFNTRDDDNPHIEFYRRRKKYYDDTYGYSDVVFAAAKFLEANPERIPTYEQIVVDEFQDFNPLEVSLIELLAERSPTLLAGDDDQALYDFKHADPKHIRDRHNDSSAFEQFNLPMCSRCPRVVVDSTNDIVKAAISAGLLRGRIAKPYEYFDDVDKDKVSCQFPTLTHKQIFAKQFSWFIDTKLDATAGLVRGSFSVLVISPTRVQARSVAAALRKRGFQRVEFADKPDGAIGLLDGLKLLLKDGDSNLGWRIVAGLSTKRSELRKLLEKTESDDTQRLSAMLPSELKRNTRKMLGVLRKVKGGKDIDKDGIALLREMGVEPMKMGLEALGDELNAGDQTAKPGLRKLPIKVTTVQGSKGLAADVVFITHLDDAFFIDKEGITDKNVCNFLVALTRAKKKVFLLSSQKATPTFVAWTKAERITTE